MSKPFTVAKIGLYLGVPLILGLGLSIANADKSSTENIPVALKANEEELFPADLLSISETEAFSKYVLVVDKSKRTLAIYEREGAHIKKVEEWTADIGKNNGNKTKKDDHKTPEGIYFLEKRLNQPEIPFDLYGELAFTTNYPNFFDQLEGKTGHGIWLHAIPDSVPLTRGSRGCVVVRNEVIRKVADYIKLGETPILIFDQIEYISAAEHKRRRQEIAQYLEDWRLAWQSMDLDKYMSYYHEDFKAPGFNFKGWRRHKQNLKNIYSYINVHIYQPYILIHNDQLIVKALQRYESNKHTDYGVKTLYARKVDGQYKIVREEWVPATDRLASTTAPQTISTQ
ncbi:MAG: L,D-transpeptidase family protein [Bdellovibrionia bacterium]